MHPLVCHCLFLAPVVYILVGMAIKNKTEMMSSYHPALRMLVLHVCPFCHRAGY